MKPVAAFLISVLAATLAGAQPVETGQSAPSFTMPGEDGETKALTDLLADGPVVVVFYRGAWCPICMQQLRWLEKSRSAFEEQSATIIAISRDDPATAMRTKTRHELGFTVVSDPNNSTAKLYGALPEGESLAWPGTIVIAPDGTIVFAEIDANYLIRPDTSDVLDAVAKTKR